MACKAATLPGEKLTMVIMSFTSTCPPAMMRLKGYGKKGSQWTLRTNANN
jgi:hypothetical protein